jgi:hypothetical protein
MLWQSTFRSSSFRWAASTLAFAIAVCAAATAGAQSAILRYDPGANFSRSAIIPPDDYSSTDLNASIRVYPFRSTDGAIEQRFEQTLLCDWIDADF